MVIDESYATMPYLWAKGFCVMSIMWWISA